MLVICSCCGVEFERSLNHFNKQKNKEVFYCSKRCSNEKRKTGEETKCLTCGTVVYRSKALIDRAVNGIFFCSKKCAGEYRKNNEITNICIECGIGFHKSPALSESSKFCSRKCFYKHIQSSGRVYYSKLKGSYCEVCGFIPQDFCQLDIHHKNKDRSNNELSNLLTICANCHRLLHKEEKTLGVKNSTMKKEI